MVRNEGTASALLGFLKLRRSFIAFGILVVLLSAAVYLNTLSNGFVYDDVWVVQKNSWIRSASFIPDILTSDVWNFSSNSPSNYYRPAMYLTFMAVYHLSGLDPRAFHLVSLILNSLVCAIAFVTTTKLLQQFRAGEGHFLLSAFAAALLFATHPIHTEAVAWIAAVPELTYSLFFLLSLYLYVLSKEGTRGSYLLSIAAYFLALFCKEPALLLPIILFSYDYCLGEKLGDAKLRTRRYIPYLAIGLIYLLVRVAALGHLAQTGKYNKLAFHEALINVFPLFSEYLVKLFWPVNLNAFTVYKPVASLFTLRGGLAIVVVLMFVVFLRLTLKRSQLSFLGLVFIVTPLLPVLYIPAMPENIFAERYLFLPSFGFALLIADGLANFLKEGGSRRISAVVISVVVLSLLYSIGTMTRNNVWKDNLSFYSDILKKSPDVPMMHVDLGWTLFKMGNLESALREYSIALKIRPDLAEPHNNIGLIYEQRNQISEAIQEYRAALDIDPAYPAAHNNLGNAYMSLNLLDEAINEFQEALRLSPQYAAAHYNLGNAFSARGRFIEAVQEYKRVIVIEPYDLDAHNNLGVAYLSLNRVSEAIDQFNLVLRQEPNFLPARKNLEMVLKRGI